ncbi:response regulator [Psychroflexus sp. CAK8W]|uniref:Response regulator n=1 Tax=Psychroflexus longus TaxID=2873596 RepID=A0ABS7XEP7_9FLAO|nr:response regulator [Psychroflexus longus]MBZ9777420.1 response regulator [Psychroflexus longus]
MNNKISIAIVDDHSLVGFATKQMFKSCSSDLDLVTYQNPEQFITDMTTGDLAVPSVILCDYNMPEMTGLEVHDSLKEILKEHSDLPQFYLVSSEDNLESYALNFKSDFFSGSYQKPLQPNKVEEILNLSLVNLAS